MTFDDTRNAAQPGAPGSPTQTTNTRHSGTSSPGDAGPGPQTPAAAFPSPSILSPSDGSPGEPASPGDTPQPRRPFEERPPLGHRYALLVEYDGTPFVGWQRQGVGLSIQQVIEQAAAHLNSGTIPPVMAAGRTDAGVHAIGQVVQVDLPQALKPERVREAINFHSRPHPVSIVKAARAPAGWSARFSAIGRAYRYRILNRRARPALDIGHAWHVPQPLDAEAMHRAAQTLLGRHDFSAYRAASCQAKNPWRTLDRLDLFRDGDEVVMIVEARSFLHHQVRNLIGTLAQVGMGRQPETWPRQVLDGRDRAKAGQTAPPEGLVFTRVQYPETIDWE